VGQLGKREEWKLRQDEGTHIRHGKKMSKLRQGISREGNARQGAYDLPWPSSYQGILLGFPWRNPLDRLKKFPYQACENQPGSCDPMLGLLICA
jgi:hypothetical protein